MAKKRKGTNTGVPGLSFSWKRATGITKIRSDIARATGIPTTRSGVKRKVGRAITKAVGVDTSFASVPRWGKKPKKGSNTGIPGLSFSLKRASGLTRLQNEVSRQTGVPLSNEGRLRKLGSVVVRFFGIRL